MPKYPVLRLISRVYNRGVGRGRAFNAEASVSAETSGEPERDSATGYRILTLIVIGAMLLGAVIQLRSASAIAAEIVNNRGARLTLGSVDEKGIVAAVGPNGGYAVVGWDDYYRSLCLYGLNGPAGKPIEISYRKFHPVAGDGQPFR